jgi:hypothetical protein
MTAVAIESSIGIRPCAYKAIMAGKSKEAVRIKAEILKFGSCRRTRLTWISNDIDHARFAIGQMRVSGLTKKAARAHRALLAFVCA